MCRLIEPEVFLDIFNFFLGEVLRGIGAAGGISGPYTGYHLFNWPPGNRLDKGKTDDRDPKKRRDHEKKPPDDVIFHSE